MNTAITERGLLDLVNSALREAGVDTTCSDTWPYEHKSQLQIGSSSIIVSYPPKKVLPAVHNWRETVFDQDIVPPREVSLYFHVPFCTGRCRYCGFKTVYAGTPPLDHEPYLQALRREVDFVTQWASIGEKSTTVSLYIGGGTPTCLPPSILHSLVEYIRKSFRIADDAEFTIEASPETLTMEYATALAAMGFTRVSLGVQTFCDSILKTMRRRHNAKDAHRAVDILHRAGHQNVNVDLIKCYPMMSLKTIAHDLEIIASLMPSSVTTYDLAVRQDAQLWQDFQHNRGTFLTEPEILRQSIAYDIGLRTLGYSVGPVGWYTLTPQARYRQQFDKWECGIPLVAFGNSAYGYYNNHQYYNFTTVPQYVSRIRSGKLPIEFAYHLSDRECLRRRLVFGVKSGITLSKELEAEATACGEWHRVRAIIDKLTHRGLITESNQRLAMTGIGRAFSEQIAREFYSFDVLEAEREDAKL